MDNTRIGPALVILGIIASIVVGMTARDAGRAGGIGAPCSASRAAGDCRP